MLSTLALFAIPALFGAEPSADPRLAGYRTPPGWKVEIAAIEPMVVNPVTMTWAPDGRLFVVEWVQGQGSNDHIKILTDEDGNGTFDKAEMYMDGLELPAGIAFWDGWTYITLGHDVVRFHDPDLDGKYDKKEAIVTGFGNDNSHHRVSGLTIGPDGWLYMTTGDSDAHAVGSDGSRSDVLRCGGVFRCKPDGSKLENFAFGMRNPWGNVAFDDEFRMFHTDNDNEGAPGFTGCRLLHVVDGGDYGWRLREGARCCQPDFDRATWNGGRPGRLGSMAETGRGAPAGLCVLNSAAFPPSTRNLLIYPDVFRKLVRAYTVKPVGATFTVDKEFELLASDEGLFRPTDAEIGPDGALYILDWRTDSGGAGALQGNGKTGRIYRMTWSGTAKEPGLGTLPRDRLTRLRRGSIDDLYNAFYSEDYGTRLASSHELIRRLEAAKGKNDGSFEAIVASFNRPLNPGAGQRIDGFRDAGTVYRLYVLRSQPVHFQAGLGARDPADRAMVFATLARALSEGVTWPLQFLASYLDYETPEAVRKRWSTRGNLAETDPEALRSLALLLGRFGGLRRARDGEDLDLSRLHREFEEELFRNRGEAEKSRAAQRFEEALKRFDDGLSSDMVANSLLGLAVRNLNGDPFLRDSFTRGLERLGPAGIEAVVKALGSDDPKRSEAALYILQGWRAKDGLDALMAEATTEKKIPTNARVGMFRALREMGEAVAPDPIARWIVAAKDADPAARGEAIKVLSAMKGRAINATAAILPDLLNDPQPEVRAAALNLAATVRSLDAKARLVEGLKAEGRSAEEKRLIVAALRGYDDKKLVPIFESRMGAEKDGGVLGELLRALAPLDFGVAAKHAENLLSTNDAALRGEAIAVLGQKPETALVVARLYNDGKLPKQDLSRVIEAIRQHGTVELREANQELIRKTVLAAPAGAEAGKLREFVERRGNAERGKSIFLDNAKGNCASCHRLEGQGGAVGPDLTRVWQTLSFEKRVESILEPSKEIKEGYGTFKVATKDGRVVSGLLMSNAADGVTIKDAQGRELKIPAGDIEEKGTDPVSLMPAGVVGHLSLDELADLLSFLGSQSAQEKMRGAK